MKSSEPQFPLDDNLNFFFNLLAIALFLGTLVYGLYVEFFTTHDLSWLFLLPLFAAGGLILLAMMRRENQINHWQSTMREWRKMCYQTGENHEQRYEGRDFLPINGPTQFEESVRRILEELKTKPSRYREVCEYLPKVEYEPNFKYGGNNWKGRSDGKFGFDGTNASYEHFRWVFLHEVGHNVYGKRNNDWSEEVANRYADEVTRELGA